MSAARSHFRKFARTRGEVYVWLTSMGLVIGLMMILFLLGLILVQGFEVFWPKRIAVLTLTPQSAARLGPTDRIAGEVVKKQERKVPSGDGGREREWQLKIANRDVFGASYKYLPETDVRSVEFPEDVIEVERMEYGDAIGFPSRLSLDDGKQIIEAGSPAFEHGLEEMVGKAARTRGRIERIEKIDIGRINSAMTSINNRARALERRGQSASAHAKNGRIRMADLQKRFDTLAAEARKLREEQNRDVLFLRLASGQEAAIGAGNIVGVVYPNRLSFPGRLAAAAKNFWAFLSQNPREANTEGGIFPAIFGTAVMTLMMSIAVMPFGVIAAIYLREYAVQGLLVRSVRIAVNNLAGVPSIVFGVFGLGFFVYVAGGTIDQVFFSETLPTPTFGTGGILWASLTLALMTVPVVIVATEEALAAVPRGAREGSLACGASKWQTIERVVLPAAAPGILTGLILAMARGAGEVAPLMLVGVVKLAPSLPLDAEAPFLHLERKFMHMAFHIFDLGFQSPDSEAAKPMVFATTLLLILLVVVLNLAAILLRERLRKKYAAATF